MPASDLRKKTLRSVLIHIALLAGCVVFGLPFFWMLLTSFKEDSDLSSYAGLVWIPKVQETMRNPNPDPPMYETRYQGETVSGPIIGRGVNGKIRINVVHPFSLSGYTVDTLSSSVKLIPQEAPLVRGNYSGTAIQGLVTKEMEDGRRRVLITSPSKLKGLSYVAFPQNIIPIRRPGLRWQNYTEALEYMPAEANHGLSYLENTLIIVILSVFGTLLSSSVVAYAFARLRFPGRDILFAILLSTMMLPGAVTLLPSFLIFKNLGWIDTLLPLWAPAFFAGAFNVFLLRQFFKTIPQEIEDASKLDGCSPLGTYWRVMLPQIRPALAVVGIWTFIGAWNNFMGPLIYITSPSKMTLSYAVQLFSTDRNSQPGLVMAFAVMATVPILLLFFFAQRYFTDRLTIGAYSGRL